MARWPGERAYFFEKNRARHKQRSGKTVTRSLGIKSPSDIQAEMSELVGEREPLPFTWMLGVDDDDRDVVAVGGFDRGLNAGDAFRERHRADLDTFLFKELAQVRDGIVAEVPSLAELFGGQFGVLDVADGIPLRERRGLRDRNQQDLFDIEVAFDLRENPGLHLRGVARARELLFPEFDGDELDGGGVQQVLLGDAQHARERNEHR